MYELGARGASRARRSGLMWAYLRALLYTMFCDGLRDALFPFFAARDPARRDLGER